MSMDDQDVMRMRQDAHECNAFSPILCETCEKSFSSLKELNDDGECSECAIGRAEMTHERLFHDYHSGQAPDYVYEATERNRKK